MQIRSNEFQTGIGNTIKEALASHSSERPVGLVLLEDISKIIKIGRLLSSRSHPCAWRASPHARPAAEPQQLYAAGKEAEIPAAVDACLPKDASEGFIADGEKSDVAGLWKARETIRKYIKNERSANSISS